MKFQDLHGVKNGVNRKDFFQKRSREMHFYNTPTSLKVTQQIHQDKISRKISQYLAMKMEKWTIAENVTESNVVNGVRLSIQR